MAGHAAGRWASYSVISSGRTAGNLAGCSGLAGIWLVVQLVDWLVVQIRLAFGWPCSGLIDLFTFVWHSAGRAAG